MKTKLLILATALLALSFSASAQCSTGTVDGCARKLNEGFTFLKSMKVEMKGRNFVEYSNVFSKGNMYMLKACQEAAPDMIIEIYDNTRRLIGTNFNKGKLLTDYVALKCSNTSIYYIKFKFPEGKSATCGVGVLGFK